MKYKAAIKKVMMKKFKFISISLIIFTLVFLLSASAIADTFDREEDYYPEYDYYDRSAGRVRSYDIPRPSAFSFTFDEELGDRTEFAADLAGENFEIEEGRRRVIDFSHQEGGKSYSGRITLHFTDASISLITGNYNFSYTEDQGVRHVEYNAAGDIKGGPIVQQDQDGEFRFTRGQLNFEDSKGNRTLYQDGEVIYDRDHPTERVLYFEIDEVISTLDGPPDADREDDAVAPVTGADEGDPSEAAPPLTTSAAVATGLGGLAAAAGGGGGGGAAGTTGAAASPFADEVVTTMRSDESTDTPSDSSRTDEEIVDDPRLGDRVVDVNGEEHIYTTRPNDDAGPGWQSVEDYEKEQHHREQGHIYSDGTWWTPEGHQQHESSLSQHRQDAAEDLKQRHQEAAEERMRSEIKREAAEKEAGRLESIAEQVKSGRHSLSDSDNAREFVERLEEAGKNLRETGEYSEIDEDIIERTFDRVRPEMEQMQGETYEELDRAQRSAQNWDRATWAAEKAEEYATASVDKLAKVTGPAGRTVQSTYHVVRTVTGGVAEGHATGEYGRSITNAGADVVESRLSGWKKNAFNIGRGATESAYEAHQEGESIMQGALEGSAGQASEIAGKSVKGTFGDVGKYIYETGESAFQSGYENI